MLGEAAHANDTKDYNIATLFQFLNEPATVILRDQDLTWIRSEQYIRRGSITSSGDCTFSAQGNSSEFKFSRHVITREIAVNRKTCESLVVEGEPTQQTWDTIQAVLHASASSALENSPNTSQPRVSSLAATTAYDPNAQDKFGYALTYTDENNPLIISLGNLFHFTAAEISAGVTYEYNSDAPVLYGDANACNVHMSQYAGGAGGSRAGFAGWAQTQGVACLTYVSYFSSSALTLRNAWDFNGNATVANPSFCDIPINATPYCHGGGLYADQGAQTLRLAAVNSGEFYNDTLIPFAFDCRAGITLSVPYVYVNVLPNHTFNYNYSTTIIGGADGPTWKCRSNLALTTAATNEVGVPY